MIRTVITKAYPNGTCYCGCRTAVSDRTAFWVRGHDALAAHRVIREHYGNVADFVVAHEDTPPPELADKVGRLEALVFPKGQAQGASLNHQRPQEAWTEMRSLAGEIVAEGVPVECPGARSVLHLASALLTEHDQLTSGE
jgi:hypothetical protein